MDQYSRIFVAGHRGLVGSALWRALQRQGFANLIGRTRAETGSVGRGGGQCVLRRGKTGIRFRRGGQGGRHSGEQHLAAEFIYDNLPSKQPHSWRVQLASKNCCSWQFLHLSQVRTTADEGRISADRPAGTNQRMVCRGQNRRHQALRGLPPPIRLDFISAMPTNLYGPNDNYDLETSHVLPALIRKFHEAKFACAPPSSAGEPAPRSANFFTPMILPTRAFF